MGRSLVEVLPHKHIAGLDLSPHDTPEIHPRISTSCYLSQRHQSSDIYQSTTQVQSRFKDHPFATPWVAVMSLQHVGVAPVGIHPQT
jgi:hypothetical protein